MVLCKVIMLFISSFFLQNLYSDYSLNLAIGNIFIKNFGETKDTKVNFKKLPLKLKYGNILETERAYAKINDKTKKGPNYIIIPKDTSIQIEENISLKDGKLKIRNNSIKIGTFIIESSQTYFLSLNREKHYLDIINISQYPVKVKSLIGRFKKKVRMGKTLRLDLVSMKTKKLKHNTSIRRYFIQPTGILIDDIMETKLHLEDKSLKSFKAKIK